MADIRETLEAKSDQLNATDLAGVDLVIKITGVTVKKGSDQPVWVHFEGDHNRPWKPSKGMRRLLAGAWGTETDAWTGKSAKLYCDPSVTWAGKEVGGIRIRALSDIDPNGKTFIVAHNRTKREPFHVECLQVQTVQYPADQFEQALPAMAEKMKEGKMTLQQVIARCQKTGQLTQEQLKRLEEVAPVEIDNDDEEIM